MCDNLDKVKCRLHTKQSRSEQGLVPVLKCCVSFPITLTRYKQLLSQMSRVKCGARRMYKRDLTSAGNHCVHVTGHLPLCSQAGIYNKSMCHKQSQCSLSLVLLLPACLCMCMQCTQWKGEEERKKENSSTCPCMRKSLSHTCWDRSRPAAH